MNTLKPPSSTSVQADRVAEALTQQSEFGPRGFILTAPQRQQLYALLRRAYQSGHGDAEQKLKEI